ncbi:tir chaperone family protein [Yersinia ruckeri]|uniref:type III secretion system chaperone n=1 Tax=Yersinia ruckeri TaxID=29486 RepID=UPI0005ABD271|nr:type III secretion system chaperone [Yersinia ruckeri]AJI94816.1 tir chaperone family protein [Yersinia ruckeri]MCW6566901.1 type III secretion system chaperone [Yersinia ruckeri]
MEQDLQRFHTTITELLMIMGFESPDLNSNQTVITLTIDDLFQIDCCAIDQESWVVSANMGPVDHYSLPKLQSYLRKNAPSDYIWQPTFAIDEDNRLLYWLRLPLNGIEIPMLLSIISAFISDVNEQASIENIFSLSSDGVALLL